MMKKQKILFLFLAIIYPSWIFAESLPQKKEKEPPQGFKKDILLVTISRGSIYDIKGSLIDHEKEYDRSLKARNTMEGIPLIVEDQAYYNIAYPIRFSTSKITRIDFEYGITDHLGLGISSFAFSLDVIQMEMVSRLLNQQESPYKNRDFISPIPFSRRLFGGTSTLFSVSYHFFPNKRFDPFIAVRGGIVRFRTSAHASLNPEPLTPFHISSSGSGNVGALGAGFFLYLLGGFALRFEVDSYRFALKAETFSRRSLTSVQIHAGITYNINALKKISELDI